MPESKKNSYFNETYNFALFLTTLVSAQGTWVNKSIGLPDSLGYPVLSKIDACDSVTAILFCHPIGPEWFRSSIFLTTNAGNSWTEVIGPEEVYDYSITCGSILDKNHFWFTTEEYAPFGGKIFATADGGKTWTKQYDNPSATNYMNYIEMFDLLNGMAMGDPVVSGSTPKPAVFLRTTDGGQEWKSMNSSNLKAAISGDVWRRMDFINADNGYFCASGQMFVTTNGGAAFSPINFDDKLSVMKFYDMSTGVVFITKTSGNSYTGRTFDGGNTWSMYRFPIAKGHGWGTDIEFIPGEPAKLWGAQGKGLFFSGDTGRTWTRYDLETPGAVYDIHFTDKSHGWLISENSVWYTSTGNSTPTEVAEVKPAPSQFKLYQNYPNPFNPSTIITYEINSGSLVQLKVFNILGSEKATLVSDFQKPGQYQVKYNPDGLSGGIYLIQLTAGNQVDVRKMIYLK